MPLPNEVSPLTRAAELEPFGARAHDAAGIDELYPRHLRVELSAALAAARVVNLIGPRQVGKTTLVRDQFGGGRFVTLDDSSVLDALEEDPQGQLATLAASATGGPLIIDEAQRSKRLALAIKRIVDQRRRPGQFLLTGSSNVFATAEIADSLAGRVRTIRMLPLSTAEIHRAGPARLLDWAVSDNATSGLSTLPPIANIERSYYVDLLVRGGYPEIRALGDRARRARYRDYIDSVVDRDVADLLMVRKTDALRRLIDQLAVRTGNELNVEELSGQIGIRRETTETYLDALTRLSLIIRLGAWTSGEVKREIKHAKVHLVDSGVAAALRNLRPTSFAPDANPTALGGLLETFVHAELLKNLPFQDEDWRLYHWRGERGREVDIVAERDRDLVLIEVKASATVAGSDLVNLRWFMREGPGRGRAVTSILIHLGERALSFGDRLFALPLSVFWSYPSTSEDG